MCQHLAGHLITNERGLLRQHIDLGGYISKRGFGNILRKKDTLALVEE